MQIEELRPLIEHEISEVLQEGGTPPLELPTLYYYHMGLCDRNGQPENLARGKYIRSLLCLAMCGALGGNKPERAIEECLPAAASVELVHRTSLIFDDIQDGGTERNQRPTVWAIWGQNQAINAGLALSCFARLALHRMSDPHLILKVQGILERAVVDVCRGQHMDIGFSNSMEVTVESYLEMVRGKTAALVGAACEVGALVALFDSATSVELNRFRCLAREFGINLGIAFQMRDDYLGVWGDEARMGKTANDLTQKKRTLPMVLALEADREYVTRWLKGETKIQQSWPGWMAWMGIPEKIQGMEATFIQTAGDNLKAMAYDCLTTRFPLQREWEAYLVGVLEMLSKREV